MLAVAPACRTLSKSQSTTPFCSPTANFSTVSATWSNTTAVCCEGWEGCTRGREHKQRSVETRWPSTPPEMPRRTNAGSLGLTLPPVVGGPIDNANRRVGVQVGYKKREEHKGRAGVDLEGVRIADIPPGRPFASVLIQVAASPQNTSSPACCCCCCCCCMARWGRRGRGATAEPVPNKKSPQ